MVSKPQIKLIQSLIQKKYRDQHGLFTVEGVKGITEFLNSSYKLHALYSTAPIFNAPKTKTFSITNAELKTLSALKNPNTALALFEIPKVEILNNNGLIIALDAIRDPGNLGTIIRLCDWFNVKQIVCGNGTVNCYNPKVVQATMGSLTRVSITYLDLEDYLDKAKTSIIGTLLEGDNIYTTTLPDKGIIVLGNEANGISEIIKSKINKAITIPQFNMQHLVESLNVATATAIVLSEFKRRIIEM